ncbi:hypothetical protein C8Q76DRAFT_708683 [Earliella scabrosa]|nr:hypothetical protein C8Q76DRAFT_708683 [Earliella scabrosa]
MCVLPMNALLKTLFATTRTLAWLRRVRVMTLESAASGTLPLPLPLPLTLLLAATIQDLLAIVYLATLEYSKGLLRSPVTHTLFGQYKHSHSVTFETPCNSETRHPDNHVVCTDASRYPDTAAVSSRLMSWRDDG